MATLRDLGPPVMVRCSHPRPRSTTRSSGMAVDVRISRRGCRSTPPICSRNNGSVSDVTSGWGVSRHRYFGQATMDSQSRVRANDQFSRCQIATERGARTTGTMSSASPSPYRLSGGQGMRTLTLHTASMRPLEFGGRTSPRRWESDGRDHAGWSADGPAEAAARSSKPTSEVLAAG